MKQNMGRMDRTIRVLIAVAIAIHYFTGIISGTAGYILLAVASIFILTSLVGSCPLYTVFGITSCKVKSR
jgi:hypothetical protein